MSSLERLGEAGWLPDVRKEESLRGQACNQPIGHTVRYSEYGFTFQISQPLYTEAGPWSAGLTRPAPGLADMTAERRRPWSADLLRTVQP